MTGEEEILEGKASKRNTMKQELVCSQEFEDKLQERIGINKVREVVDLVNDDLDRGGGGGSQLWGR